MTSAPETPGRPPLERSGTRRRLMEGAARSRRWARRQASRRADSELGAFDFLVLCFEQVSIAGAAMNCFRSRQASASSSSGSTSSDSTSDSDSAALFPETVAMLPLAILSMVFFSFAVVWLSPWIAGCCRTSCCCAKSRAPLCTTRRHAMPVITVVLKLLFLNYVVGMLSRSPAFELKQQLGDLLAALLLLLCELVDMFALMHTWWVEYRRARADPLTILDVAASHEQQMSARKRLILTFFDRWKDCGTVSSFLSQNELLLLFAEMPSMMWAAWTACSSGNTSDNLSYHLHRVLTMATIVMGTFVMDEPQLSSDIQGAVVFLIADVALSTLSVYNGRIRKRHNLETQAQALSPVHESSGVDTPENAAVPPSPGNNEASCSPNEEAAYSGMTSERRTSVSFGPMAPPVPNRTNESQKSCLRLKLVWEVMRTIAKRQWAKVIFDCMFIVYVILNFFETLQGSAVQSQHDPSTSEDWSHLQDQVNNIVIIMDCVLGAMLALTLAFRWSYAYSSSSVSSQLSSKFFCVNRRNHSQGGPRSEADNAMRSIELAIQCVKITLFALSIYVFGVVFVNARLLVVKDGINSLIAWMIGMLTIANIADAFGRALRHGSSSRSSIGSTAPTLMVENGVVTARAKLNTAIQVLWDRLNDFLCPLSLVHVIIDYSGDIAVNFTVFYLVLVVCVLHAAIAYLDRIDVTSSSYSAERFGYLVAVSMVAIASKRYQVRAGTDIFAPTQLVFINFAQQLIVLVGATKQWGRRWWRHRSRTSAQETNHRLSRVDTLEVPILSSLAEDSPSNDVRGSMHREYTAVV